MNSNKIEYAAPMGLEMDLALGDYKDVAPTALFLKTRSGVYLTEPAYFVV
jgi:hypothetical protein